MANEITINSSLSFAKAGVTMNTEGASFTNLLFNVTGNNYIKLSVSVGTSPQLLSLGPVVSPHWSVFQNQDSSNFITLRNGGGGAVLLRLLAGEIAVCPLDPLCLPYAQADTAACILSYLIISA